MFNGFSHLSYTFHPLLADITRFQFACPVEKNVVNNCMQRSNKDCLRNNVISLTFFLNQSLDDAAKGVHCWLQIIDEPLRE